MFESKSRKAKRVLIDGHKYPDMTEKRMAEVICEKWRWRWGGKPTPNNCKYSYFFSQLGVT